MRYPRPKWIPIPIDKIFWHYDVIVVNGFVGWHVGDLNYIATKTHIWYSKESSKHWK